MTESRFSPKTSRVLVTVAAAVPLVLGAMLIVYTPAGTFGMLSYWIGLAAWTVVGVVLMRTEITKQVPEVESLRHPRRPFLEGHHFVRAGVFVAVLVLLIILRRATEAPATTALGAFMSGISGFLLVQGAGYTYELGFRERLRYCNQCEGHRAFIHWQGNIVCGICGRPWSGETREWQRPPESPSRRRAKHAFAEFFLVGPFWILMGIFGVEALPAIGRSDWVALPLFLMLGGLCATVVLYRRFTRRIQANFTQAQE